MRDKVRQLPENKVPIVIAGGSFNKKGRNTKVEKAGCEILEKFIKKVDGSKAFFVIGHKMQGYEREVIDICKKLNKNIESKELILKSIKTAYENNIVGMKLNNLLEQNILLSEIESYLDKLFNDLDFNENNQYIVDKIVLNCIESEFKFIDKDTKDYIVKCIVDALLTTGIGFTVDAMKALKLKEITTEQVEIMDPREIHMLFKAFAGDFFIKLYLYGSMGAVFGINMYLSILLGIVDWFYSKKVDEFEISTDNIFKE